MAHMHRLLDFVYAAADQVERQRFHEQELDAINAQLGALGNDAQGDRPLVCRQPTRTPGDS